MTDKNTYWIADVDGNKALVQGSAERDRWTQINGWTEADEPQGLQFVWLRNEQTGGRAKFAAQAVPLWEGLGWKPSAPPEPVNLAIGPEHPSRAAQAPDAEPAAPPKTPSRIRAASGDEKE
jgi:hypothetical protein